MKGRVGHEAGADTVRLARLGGLALVLLLPTASCVPAGTATLPVAASRAPASVDASPATVLAVQGFTVPAASIDPTANIAVPPGAAPAINASIPFAVGPNPAAAAFFHSARGPADRARSLRCLTEAVYYEAASESGDGQRAVAQVVLNRMRHPAYPATVCGVVYQDASRWMACQFSFACDGARGRAPSVMGWAGARTIAASALAGRVFAPVGLATHYHTRNVVPFWARTLAKSAVVGAHIFYRLNGALGAAPAFRQRYAGFEPGDVPIQLASAVPVVAPILPIDLSVLLPSADAALDFGSAPTPPERAQSPIMAAVPGSTVHDRFADSGRVRPEYAGR